MHTSTRLTSVGPGMLLLSEQIHAVEFKQEVAQEPSFYAHSQSTNDKNAGQLSDPSQLWQCGAKETKVGGH